MTNQRLMFSKAVRFFDKSVQYEDELRALLINQVKLAKEKTGAGKEIYDRIQTQTNSIHQVSEAKANFEYEEIWMSFVANGFDCLKILDDMLLNRTLHKNLSDYAMGMEKCVCLEKNLCHLFTNQITNGKQKLAKLPQIVGILGGPSVSSIHADASLLLVERRKGYVAMIEHAEKGMKILDNMIVHRNSVFT